MNIYLKIFIVLTIVYSLVFLLKDLLDSYTKKNSFNKNESYLGLLLFNPFILPIIGFSSIFYFVLN